MVTIKQLQTLTALSAALVVLFLLSHNHFFLYAAIVLLVILTVSNTAASMLVKAWEWLTDKIGTAVRILALSLVFILVVIPIGFLRKIFGAKPAAEKTSYYIKYHSSFNKPFFDSLG